MTCIQLMSDKGEVLQEIRSEKIRSLDLQILHFNNYLYTEFKDWQGRKSRNQGLSLFPRVFETVLCIFHPKRSEGWNIHKTVEKTRGKSETLISTFTQDSIFKLGIYVILCHTYNEQKHLGYIWYTIFLMIKTINTLDNRIWIEHFTFLR